MKHNLGTYFYKYQKYKKKYILAKQGKIFNQTGGDLQKENIWIEDNFFEEKDFNKIINYSKNLQLKNDIRSNNRFSLCLKENQHQEFYDMIYSNQKFIDYINSIKDDDVDIKLKPSFPVEYRKYFTGSQGMNWHQDTSLFEPDCFEVVLTLTNNSDSKFKWIDGNMENSVSPKANTLTIVRPKSVLHSVTPVNSGERTILKFVVEFIRKGDKNNTTKEEFPLELEKCPF